MSLPIESHSASELSSKTRAILEELNEKRQPIYVTEKGETRGVLLDPKTYEDDQAAMNLLSLLIEREAQVDRGEFLSHEETFDELEAYLDQQS